MHLTHRETRETPAEYGFDSPEEYFESGERVEFTYLGMEFETWQDFGNPRRTFAWVKHGDSAESGLAFAKWVVSLHERRVEWESLAIVIANGIDGLDPETFTDCIPEDEQFDMAKAALETVKHSGDWKY
jgi:hypothetical protein